MRLELSPDDTEGFKDLSSHFGHEIEIASYGRSDSWPEGVNIAIECVTCYTVLLDYDNPEWVAWMNDEGEENGDE